MSPAAGPQATDPEEKPLATCLCCPHRCRLREGQTGFCRAREAVRTPAGLEVVDANYGRVTSLALDPVEKKPLAAFLPGTWVVSVGSYGCNLRCPWCQNHAIAQCGSTEVPWGSLSPAQLVETARKQRAQDPRVAGIAWTYNEPLCGWEQVRDGFALARQAELATVLVTNGCFEPAVIDAVAPLTDAVNVDLKCFSAEGYRSLGGDLGCVQTAIERFAREPGCHVEVTCLVVPGFNDSEDEMDRLATWLAGVDERILLHVTRFFPAWRAKDLSPTPVPTVRRLAQVASGRLPQVRTGNC